MNNIQQEIIDEFSFYDDWMDKYAMIIEYGNQSIQWSHTG